LPGDVGFVRHNQLGKEASLADTQRVEGIWSAESCDGILVVVHRVADGAGVAALTGSGKARVGHVSQGVTAKPDAKQR